MKTLWLIMAFVSVVGCGEEGSWRDRTPKKQLRTVVVFNDRQNWEARTKELEARVEQLENWATKHGGRMKR